MKIEIQYFASLREQADKNAETFEFQGITAADLYAELLQKYSFTLTEEQLKVAINEEYCAFSTVLNEQDTIVFIPPVAGG